MEEKEGEEDSHLNHAARAEAKQEVDEAEVHPGLTEGSAGHNSQHRRLKLRHGCGFLTESLQLGFWKEDLLKDIVHLPTMPC
jgi:hypothetical protein